MNIESESDFNIFLDGEMKKSKVKEGSKRAIAIEEFALKCFKFGVKTGQLAVNIPIDLHKISERG